ncbi:ATP-sensitive inward rectifier potassium channel 12-like [Octopus sinensis]|nr:ATP-sensitive inward rectifier potassium channel 12-like [Octopus sinensis]
MVGMMYDRFSKNNNRAQTILFSRNAVICQRDNFPCFVFRTANLQATGLVDCQVVLKFVYSTITEEQETILLDFINLQVGEDDVSQEIEFCTPVLIAHRITPASPIYDYLEKGLEESQFEILVLLTGCDEATGVTIQARVSYLPRDIILNHRFVMIESLSNSNDWILDFKKFHSILPE